MLNQVLRQCGHIKNPLVARNLQPIINKTKAIEDLKTEIRKYQNNSNLSGEYDYYEGYPT